MLGFDFVRGKVIVAEVQRVEEYVGNHEFLMLRTRASDGLRVTPEHPMFDGERWFSSKDLALGGRVFSAFRGVVAIPPARLLGRWECTSYNLRTGGGAYLVGAEGFVAADRPMGTWGHRRPAAREPI